MHKRYTHAAGYLPYQPGFEHQVSYQSFVVPAGSPLSSTVSDFYEFSVEENNANTFTIPDGCADFMFIIRGSDADGIMTIGKDHRADMSFGEHDRVFGVRFRPGAVKQILGVPAKSLVNSRIPLRDLVTHGDLCRKILSSSDFDSRVATATQHITDTINSGGHCSNVTTYCVDRIIETSGTVAVQTLSDETGYSVRYLQNGFAESIGFSPKHFSSFVKLQKSLFLVARDQRRRALSDIALECGYYDQSHMTRSYQKLIGMAPGQFFSQAGCPMAANE